jgi:hypothetical protein
VRTTARHGAWLDPQAAAVDVGYHLIRTTGQGLVRRRKRKGNREGLLLRVPQWSVPVRRGMQARLR